MWMELNLQTSYPTNRQNPTPIQQKQSKNVNARANHQLRLGMARVLQLRNERKNISKGAVQAIPLLSKQPFLVRAKELKDNTVNR